MRIAIAFMWMCIVAEAFGQSSFERELTQLTENRDKELAAVSKPIQSRYKLSLDQLLQRATRSGDFEAATKVKEAIAKLSASSLVGKQLPKSPEDLKDFLHDTTWNITDASPTGDVKYTLTFNRNGTFKHSDGRTGQYEVTGANTFKMWGYDPAVLNPDFNQFRAEGSATIYFGSLKSN